MGDHFELIHTEENDPLYNMPYTPAIKVRSGSTVYVAGVTAAPVYHHHPHIKSDFEHIPLDPGEQTRMAMENLRKILRAAGGDLTDIVQLFRFICDIAKNQDAINKVMAEYMGDHRATSTTVEVTRLATDDRLVVELAAVAVAAE
ncbi:MAG: RidA family protein [Chloroflexi bacterium]|nr:RidA family protein [Chloroflexota bacterium]